METISLQGKMKFFEKRVGEFFKSGVGVDRADQSFALDTVIGHGIGGKYIPIMARLAEARRWSKR